MVVKKYESEFDDDWGDCLNHEYDSEFDDDWDAECPKFDDYRGDYNNGWG